jgi:hypothetical protein
MNGAKFAVLSFLVVLASVFAAWSILDVAVPAAVNRELATRAAAVEELNRQTWPQSVAQWHGPELPRGTAAWLLAALLGVLSIAAGFRRQQVVAAANAVVLSTVVGLGALAFARPLTVGVHLMWFGSWFAW